MGFLKWVKGNVFSAAAIGIAAVAVIAAGTVVIVDRASYAAYEAEYNKAAEELRATFPALPKSVVMDNDYVKYDAEGANVTSSKSKYKKDFTYYARDAVIAPLSQAVSADFVKLDDTYLGEAITGLDRKGGAISFSLRTPKHGYADVDIALRTNWADENGVYHGIDNLTDYINIQVNGLEVKTEGCALSDSREFSHLVLKDAFLIRGENTFTFTTSEYNTYGNKDSVLYIMPDIRNVTVLTDVSVYQPVYEIDTSDFPTTYRLVDLPDLSKVKVVKKVGDKEADPDNYLEEEIDGSKLNATIDYDAKKVLVKCSPKDVKEIAIAIDESEASNTITGELDGKAVTVVVTAKDQIKATLEGKECVAKVELSGRGLARIKVLEKVSGDDSAFSALPKSFGMEEAGGELKLVTTRYYTSTTKANTGTGGSNGPSQTGNTYFAINNDDYLTAFWNWTWSGDEALCLKCTYTMSGDVITLTDCLAYNSRDEWRYCGNKTFKVTAISASEVPTHLTEDSHFKIWND